MSRNAASHDLSPILSAARHWLDTCLIGDGSVFTAESLWTASNLEALRVAFVEQPDTSADDFMTKLLRQTSRLSPQVKRLTAEVVWALLLFPSNIAADTKRGHIRRLWESSKTAFPEDSTWLSDASLRGIGSGGTGYNNHRPRELAYLLTLACEIKKLPAPSRKSIINEYDAFTGWIAKVPMIGNRQFPHMLRYLAFPDRVERMASNGERRAVLEAFSVAKAAVTRQWSDRQLDEALLTLRQQQQQKFPGQPLDFYDPPLREVWQEGGPGPGNPPVEEPPETVEDSTAVSLPTGPARNIIYYGPPGTGKTRLITILQRAYVEKNVDTDANAWLEEQVAEYGWRPVIAAAMANLGAPTKVAQIREHPWVQAKVRERKRSGSVHQTIWGYLLEHTPESNEYVKNAVRRVPFIFDRDRDGLWKLASDWREQDEEAAELTNALSAGIGASASKMPLWRMVTFHPSFGYEEFVRGIRPVASEDGTESGFQVVDGEFKSLCDLARRFPKKRFALFIDEINRANIAKVFGELITLIEPDKRIKVDDTGRVTAGIQVHLSGSQGRERSEPPFGVPANLDIYGTMNTADRSIALLDIALRRRFEFVEMAPDYVVLDRKVGNVQLDRLLRRINDRLEFLLDRDHRIGHGYLTNVDSLAGLREVFAKRVIPLLQEYFFDDLSRVATVLTTSAKGSSFVLRERLDYRALFGAMAPDGIPAERERHVVTKSEEWTEQDFVNVYEYGSAPAVGT